TPPPRPDLAVRVWYRVDRFGTGNGMTVDRDLQHLTARYPGHQHVGVLVELLDRDPFHRGQRALAGAPWPRLYFLPDPPGQGAFRAGSLPLAVVTVPAGRSGSAASRVGAEYCRCAGRDGWSRPLAASFGWWSATGGASTSPSAAATAPCASAGASGSGSPTCTSRLNRNPTDSSLIPSSMVANIS